MPNPQGLDVCPQGRKRGRQPMGTGRLEHVGLRRCPGIGNIDIAEDRTRLGQDPVHGSCRNVGSCSEPQGTRVRLVDGVDIIEAHCHRGMAQPESHQRSSESSGVDQVLTDVWPVVELQRRCNRPGSLPCWLERPGRRQFERSPPVPDRRHRSRIGEMQWHAAAGVQCRLGRSPSLWPYRSWSRGAPRRALQHARPASVAPREDEHILLRLRRRQSRHRPRTCGSS